MKILNACIVIVVSGLTANVSAGELHDAVAENDVANVKKLLVKGVDVNEREDLLNKTALEFAAYRGNMEIAQLLVDKGADVNASDKMGVTPLHMAALAGRDVVSKYLISKGANLEARAANGATPLYTSAQKGHKAVVNVLLEAGANASSGDKYGKAALHVASINGHVEIIDLLISGGAKVDAVDKVDNNTPLQYAASRDQPAAAEALIARGANVNHKNRKGATALGLAVVMRGKAMVDVLIKHGADVNVSTSRKNYTPLHAASLKGDVGVVELLLENGADINARTRSGKTSLDFAREKRHKDVVRLLQQHGAKSGKSSSWSDDDEY